MNGFLSKLYYACTCEDSILPDDLNLAADYIKTGRTEEPRRALVELAGENDGPINDYGAAMEEQGFINGFRFGVALANELTE